MFIVEPTPIIDFGIMVLTTTEY